MAGGNDISFEVVESKFNGYLRELHDLVPEIEFKTIIESEALAVIMSALERTKAASVAGIRANYEAREWTTFGGKKYKLEWKLPDELWARIQQHRKDALAVKLGARGLSKKAWYLLALHLGKAIPAPGYVLAANYKGNDHPENVNATWFSGDESIYLELAINSPLIPFADMVDAIRFAMLGRVGYFKQNMAHGVFSSAATRAARYPGIFVGQAAA